MVSEATLEARGFVVVRPETLAVVGQAALFRGAEMIVSAAGVGLVDGLFAKPGARVIEIQPINSSLCGCKPVRVGRGRRARVSLSIAVPRDGGVHRAALRPGVLFSFDLLLAPFLGFLNERL